MQKHKHNNELWIHLGNGKPLSQLSDILNVLSKDFAYTLVNYTTSVQCLRMPEKKKCLINFS